MKKQVCTKCRVMVEGETCPLCKGNQFSTNWLGRLYILSPADSHIAKKVGMAVEGEYAIKVR